MEPIRSDLTLGNALDLWLEHNRIRLKPTSISKYQALIDCQILPEIGNTRLSELSAATINTYLREKMRCGRVDKTAGLASSYVRSITLVINAAIRFAVEAQLMAPLKSAIQKPPETTMERDILTLAQQRRLEEGLTKTMGPTAIGILISLHAGLRIGEVCALRWENIDLQREIIHVRRTVVRVRNPDQTDPHKTCLVLARPKTRSSNRDIPISSWLLPHILTAGRRARSGFVASDTAGFVSPRTYEYRYHQALKRCGIQSINYHALRHTFATRCVEAGVDVKSLSEMLGHASVGITLNTYVHSSMDMKRAQIEKLAALTVRGC